MTIYILYLISYIVTQNQIKMFLDLVMGNINKTYEKKEYKNKTNNKKYHTKEDLIEINTLFNFMKIGNWTILCETHSSRNKFNILNSMNCNKCICFQQNNIKPFSLINYFLQPSPSLLYINMWESIFEYNITKTQVFQKWNNCKCCLKHSNIEELTHINNRCLKGGKNNHINIITNKPCLCSCRKDLRDFMKNEFIRKIDIELPLNYNIVLADHLHYSNTYYIAKESMIKDNKNKIYTIQL
jgi:hypothetical protein